MMQITSELEGRTAFLDNFSVNGYTLEMVGDTVFVDNGEGISFVGSLGDALIYLGGLCKE